MDSSATRTFKIDLSARTARLLSIGVVAALVVGYLLPPFAGDTGTLAGGLLRLAGLIGAGVLFLTPFGQLANASDTRLDERERDERDRAYPLAHQIIVGLMFVALIYTIPARPLGWWLPDSETALDLLSVFAIASLALPGVILAWRAPPDAD